MNTYFGKNLKNLRKVKGLTQKDLADDLKITFNQISDWEIGRSNPDIEILEKLAEYFNVSVDSLLGRESIQIQKTPSITEGKTFKPNTFITIGKNGERTERELSDEDAQIVNTLLDKLKKKQ